MLHLPDDCHSHHRPIAETTSMLRLDSLLPASQSRSTFFNTLNLLCNEHKLSPAIGIHDARVCHEFACNSQSAMTEGGWFHRQDRVRECLFCKDKQLHWIHSENKNRYWGYVVSEEDARKLTIEELQNLPIETIDLDVDDIPSPPHLEVMCRRCLHQIHQGNGT